MKERKFEKRCPGPVDCFGDREVLFRKVLIPLAMGDDKKFPPKNGDYRNSLVVYEANGAIYIYSSDGLYTKLSVASGVNSVNGMSGDVNLFIPEKLSELQDDMGFITDDVDSLANYTKTSDLAQVALTGSYLNLTDTPEINDGQLIINRNGSTIGSFRANQSETNTVNIRVPVYTNELINNSQFVVDGSYVHTDNNFNNEWKNKLAGLADIQTIGNNLTLTNGRLDATGGVTPQDIASAIATHNASSTAHPDIRSEIASIEGLIPDQATTSNQLADKNFVNSSIATNTANFIGTFNSLAELEAYSGPLTNNDYAFVSTVDSAGNTLYDRYKYNGSSWVFEYELNNSSFTAAQWDALNSGVTATLVNNVALQSDIPTATSDLTNDSGFITSADIPAIPTKTSDLTNNGDGVSPFATVAQLPTPITVDSDLNSTSTNPVENSALYKAVVGKIVNVLVSPTAWSAESGTQDYNSIAIITLPTGSFTDNSLIELVNVSAYNTFAKHGFVCYYAEASSQRVWISSIGKPTTNINFQFRIYEYGS